MISPRQHGGQEPGNFFSHSDLKLISIIFRIPISPTQKREAYPRHFFLYIIIYYIFLFSEFLFLLHKREAGTLAFFFLIQF